MPRRNVAAKRCCKMRQRKQLTSKFYLNSNNIRINIPKTANAKRLHAPIFLHLLQIEVKDTFFLSLFSPLLSPSLSSIFFEESKGRGSPSLDLNLDGKGANYHRNDGKVDDLDSFSQSDKRSVSQTMFRSVNLQSLLLTQIAQPRIDPSTQFTMRSLH